MDLANIIYFCHQALMIFVIYGSHIVFQNESINSKSSYFLVFSCVYYSIFGLILVWSLYNGPFAPAILFQLDEALTSLTKPDSINLLKWNELLLKNYIINLFFWGLTYVAGIISSFLIAYVITIIVKLVGKLNEFVFKDN
jgi:hypothetical protein